MPDSKKITNKAKNTINTISDDVEARDNAARRQQTPQISSSQDTNRSALNDEGQKFNRKSSSKKKKTLNAGENETIVLQENSSQRPVQLKASFLRRKMKEYEGNKKTSFLLQNIHFASLSFKIESFPC